jgi:aspartyl-tRNA(Asn)/glutamyl-tRNA(Gln) amidotransferase subunit C
MIEKKDVEYVAWLARLDLSEEEKERYTRQLGQVLEHAEKIRSLDTEDVKPTSHPIPLKNVMREDEVRPCLSQEEALSGAPRAEGGYFMVPRII